MMYVCKTQRKTQGNIYNVYEIYTYTLYVIQRVGEDITDVLLSRSPAIVLPHTPTNTNQGHTLQLYNYGIFEVKQAR